MKIIIRLIVIVFILTSVIGCATIENRNAILKNQKAIIKNQYVLQKFLKAHRDSFIYDTSDWLGHNINYPIIEQCDIEIIEYREVQALLDLFSERSIEDRDYFNRRTQRFARGENIDLCMHYAFDETEALAAYDEMSGYVIMYGLKEGHVNRDFERLAILLPLDENGEQMEPGYSQEVVYFKLRPGFTDPCPKACDY